MKYKIFFVSALPALTRLATASETTAPPYFIEGYHSRDDGFWSFVGCGDASSTYVTSGNYARCCTDTVRGCNFVTSCYGNTYYNDAGDTNLCATGETCATMTIFESPGSDTSVLDYFCWDHWTASTIYRQTATTTTSGSTSSTTPATPGSSTTQPAASATTTASSAKSTESGDKTKDSGGDSKAWIAGAVIGPVAGCVLLFGLGYWIARRRMANRNIPPQEPPQPSQLPVDVQAAYVPQYHEKDATPSRPQPSELPAS